MGTRKEGFKKRMIAGKYRGYGIVGSYFGWTFEFRKHNAFFLFSQSPFDPLGEATIGGTCTSVQTFVFCKGFTASGSLDPHKQRHVLTKGLCGTRLADSAKTELFWISLMKPGASALLSKLR